ncbi:MAG: hypothetical protein HN390_16860 [Anaerolineae bacterium]|jgi:hypothetical protein|nr:hypothetical protein [Anaerolineae bacterium]MBT7191977.1 hypothetical protein [Anaerolineae bacterium]MBT7992157.1 hypothetical protein [Anaerolineae bacterium]
MFQSPLVIGLISLFPGLGYLLLKKWRKAIITWGLLLLFVILFFLSPVESPFQKISAQLFFIVWIGQIIFSVNLARFPEKALGVYTSPAKKINLAKIKIPANTPLRKRGLYKSKEILATQLEKNEYLQAMLPGLDKAMMGIGAHQYLLGITHKYLMFLDMGFSGTPKTIEKIPFSKIESITYTKRIMMDKISIKIREKKNLSDFYISFFFREEVREFVENLDRKIK